MAQGTITNRICAHHLSRPRIPRQTVHRQGSQHGARRPTGARHGWILWVESTITRRQHPRRSSVGILREVALNNLQRTGIHLDYPNHSRERRRTVAFTHRSTQATRKAHREQCKLHFKMAEEHYRLKTLRTLPSKNTRHPKNKPA